MPNERKRRSPVVPYFHVNAMSTITVAPFGLPIELQYYATIAIPARYGAAVRAYLQHNRVHTRNSGSDEINVLLQLPGTFIVR